MQVEVSPPADAAPTTALPQAELKRGAEDLDAAETPAGKRVRSGADDALPAEGLQPSVSQPLAEGLAPAEGPVGGADAPGEQQLDPDAVQEAADFTEVPSIAAGQPVDSQQQPGQQPCFLALPACAACCVAVVCCVQLLKQSRGRLQLSLHLDQVVAIPDLLLMLLISRVVSSWEQMHVNRRRHADRGVLSIPALPLSNADQPAGFFCGVAGHQPFPL